ncbi:MAG TPA: hypothetical protein VGN12_14475 [Pirellulales bacterium]|jgi:hypothetical protein
MWPVRSLLNALKRANRRGVFLLAVAIVAVAVLWLKILPAVGRQPAVQDYVRHNEELGIDPAAKFYTELPCLPAALHRVERSLSRQQASTR